VKNTIQISTVFSFKGETFEPATIIDLDQFIKKDGALPDLHHILAVQNNIDTYSYAFEVMQQADLYFDKASGLACDCLQDGQLDFLNYIQKRDEYELHTQLQKIAKDTLNMEDIANAPEIKEALLQAFKLGRDSK